MSKPVVLLVHGAFVDTSLWAPVIATLPADLEVHAIANPLRGLIADGEYVAGVAGQYDNVILVGHSYAGAVINYAATRIGSVRALIFVAAVAPGRGVSMSDSIAEFDDGALGSALQSARLAGEDRSEFTVSSEQFRELLAADVPEASASVLARSQRPVSEIAFSQPMPVEPASAGLPSWYLVAGADRALSPAAQAQFAEQVGASTVTVNASHLVPLSHPDAVAALIMQAAATLHPA